MNLLQQTFHWLLGIIFLCRKRHSSLPGHLKLQCQSLEHFLGDPYSCISLYLLHLTIGETHSDKPIFWSWKQNKLPLFIYQYSQYSALGPNFSFLMWKWSEKPNFRWGFWLTCSQRLIVRNVQGFSFF